jgi:hypothetical protein
VTRREVMSEGTLKGNSLKLQQKDKRGSLADRDGFLKERLEL